MGNRRASLVLLRLLNGELVVTGRALSVLETPTAERGWVLMTGAFGGSLLRVPPCSQPRCPAAPHSAHADAFLGSIPQALSPCCRTWLAARLRCRTGLLAGEVPAVEEDTSRCCSC